MKNCKFYEEIYYKDLKLYLLIIIKEISNKICSETLIGGANTIEVPLKYQNEFEKLDHYNNEILDLRYRVIFKKTLKNIIYIYRDDIFTIKYISIQNNNEFECVELTNIKNVPKKLVKEYKNNFCGYIKILE